MAYSIEGLKQKPSTKLAMDKYRNSIYYRIEELFY